MRTLTAFCLLLTTAFSLMAADKPANPLVRVVTISQDGLLDKPDTAIDTIIGVLDQAAACKPDIVCLPEAFTRGEAEPLSGPTIQRLSRWAKKHSSYLIASMRIRDGEKIFNSAVLIDRTGKIVGRYDKSRPTEVELEIGISPGPTDPPVFETDFGLIGMQICFDVNWHDQWKKLKEKGAQIIFFPSAFPAARQLKTLAWLNQCFVVSSTRRGPASILDITGDTIQTTGKYQRWTEAVLPLGKQLFEVDYHVSKMRQLQQKYGSKVQVVWHHDDDLIALASLDPKLTVQQLIEEYGLTPHREYIRRSQTAQDQVRPSK